MVTDAVGIDAVDRQMSYAEENNFHKSIKCIPSVSRTMTQIAGVIKQSKCTTWPNSAYRNTQNILLAFSDVIDEGLYANKETL